MAIDPLQASLKMAGAGLEAQSARLRVISENIANAQSTSTTAGGDPYSRKTVSFDDEVDRAAGLSLVKVKNIGVDTTPFALELDPGNPAADEQRLRQIAQCRYPDRACRHARSQPQLRGQSAGRQAIERHDEPDRQPVEGRLRVSSNRAASSGVGSNHGDYRRFVGWRCGGFRGPGRPQARGDAGNAARASTRCWARSSATPSARSRPARRRRSRA